MLMIIYTKHHSKKKNSVLRDYYKKTNAKAKMDV